MKNENPIRNSLLPRNSNFVSKKINMEKNKEKINRSQRVNSNHFVYCSKYSNVRNTSINKEKEKENDISYKANNLIDEEGLDHPNPLISDSEENLEELKAQFITKGDKYESLTNKSKRKKSKDIKNLADSSIYLNITPGQGTDSKQLPAETVESNRIEGNNTPIKFNILYKKNENELALNKINQNRPKTQKIIKNHKQINKSLNNKINISYNITNKDNNNNKKENDFKVNKYIFLNKQENNKSSHNITREREEFNQILSYMDKKEKHNFNYFNEYNRKKPVINSYNYLNCGDENGREKLHRFNTINNKMNDKLNKLNTQKQVYKVCENKITQNNSINNIKEGLLKNKSNKHVYNQINSDEKENINNNNFNNKSKKEQLINRIKSGYPQKEKIIQNEYENEKNISKILWTETDIKTKSYIDNQYIIKNKCRNNNQINIDSKDLSTNNESQTIGIDKEKKLRKLNSYKFSKNKNILNTMLNKSNNLPILNSNELKTPTMKKKHVIFSKHKDGNENISKFRLKSFEKDDNFNNIQTTFIVISKNSRRKPLQKSKMPSEAQNLSRCKLPIPSVSYKNYSKCLKTKINLYSEYTLDIKDRRNIGNGHKDSGITKSVNNISVKHNNYRNELSSDQNIHHPNYKNYFDYPNITGNRRTLYSYSNRRISRLINKSK